MQSQVKVLYHCQAEGRHHTALCFSKDGKPSPIIGNTNHPNTSNGAKYSKMARNDTKETATCLVKNDTTIMLQTAIKCIMNKTEGQFCVANILLDTGSQQTFILDRVVNEPKLKLRFRLIRELKHF